RSHCYRVNLKESVKFGRHEMGSTCRPLHHLSWGLYRFLGANSSPQEDRNGQFFSILARVVVPPNLSSYFVVPKNLSQDICEFIAAVASRQYSRPRGSQRGASTDSGGQATLTREADQLVGHLACPWP